MRKRAARSAPAERRRLIIEGAERVFAASGYGADTAELARAGGVSAAALYRYFPTKKDLFVTTLAASGQRLIEIWRRIIGDAPDPLHALDAIAGGYHEHGGSQPSVMRLWFQAMSDTDAPEVRAVLSDTFTALTRMLEETVEAAQTQGLVSADLNARVAAWDFMSIGVTFEMSRVIGVTGGGLGRTGFDEWRRHYFKSIGAAEMQARPPAK